MAVLALPEAQRLFVRFDEKGGRSTAAGYHQMCFSILAEAVMRACRTHVRQSKHSAQELVAHVLGIKPYTDLDTFRVSTRASAARSGKFYSKAHRLTNCPPSAVVGVLGLLERLHRGMVRVSHLTCMAAAAESGLCPCA